jgi:hypothetical protein
MPRKSFARYGAVTLALPLLLLAACQTGPVYRPRGPGETVGYTDQELAPNRYRVTFTGTSGTHRDQVEDFLMRRAAEVTVGNGYEYFRFDDRDTEARTYYRTNFIDPAFGPGFGPYYGRFGFRPYYWSSWAFPPSWGTADVIPVTRYSAYSEIVLLTPDQARNNPDAIPAREVLARLAPPPAAG